MAPQFSAAASEGPSKMDALDDRWAENTTVVTGATSEHSFGGFGEDEAPFLPGPAPSISLPTALLRRCSRFCWLSATFLLSFLALVSAPLMAALPHAVGQLRLFVGDNAQQQQQWIEQLGSCQVDCQGQLLNLSGKTALLFLALYVLFWRRSAADLPRIFLHRAAFAFFVFFVLFAFWLFYIVRILLERNAHLPYVLSFALSLLDILLFIHCVWLFFELRQFRPVFSVQIVRDPDGEWRTQQIGQMSIQEAAVAVLRLYHAHFPFHNPFLENSRRSSALAHFRPVPPPNTGFKLYDIDGRGEGVVLPQAAERILMHTAIQRRVAGHSEMFRRECEWERQFRKRKCRLVGCTEDVFEQVQQMSADTMEGVHQKVEPMDPRLAAKSVLESIARPLRRFLRFTGQEPFFRHDQSLAHLQRCLAFGFSARTFLQRFFSSSIPFQEVLSESKWSVLCDSRVSGPLRHGLTFVLRCHDRDGLDRGVQLLCTFSSFPFLNLTEQQPPHKSAFQLKVTTAELGV
uniref:Transmembrane protein n=1 Tax=Globodera rostochiensis TaxID=31243 RepID=A0A914H0Q8_GLORO